jgi:flagellar biosynthesis/type III secretory pathway chaperone
MQSGPSQRPLDMLGEFLSEQLNMYRQLLELAKKEREALMASKIEALNDVVSQKTYLSQLLDRVEKRRIALMTELAVSFNCRLEDFTLQRLVNLIDRSTSEKFLQLRSDLTAVIKELKKENDTNKGLIAHCIMLMDNSVNILNSMLCHESTYIHTGYFSKANEGGFVFSGKI